MSALGLGMTIRLIRSGPPDPLFNSTPGQSGVFQPPGPLHQVTQVAAHGKRAGTLVGFYHPVVRQLGYFYTPTQLAVRDELVLELEDRVDAMKEFPMETLVKFGKRMKSMESKHNEEMVSVREEMRSLSFCLVKDTDSEEESESPKRRDRSTPKRTPTEESKKGKREHTFPVFQATSKKVKETVLPSKVHEIQDPIWKEKLKKHEWLILDKKEKLNQAQLAFVLHWFESNSPLTGKQDDALKLLSAGELGGFWTRDWTPEGVSDFMSYLQDKIKGQNRKVRKMKEKEALSSELEDVLNSAMFDENE